MAENLPHLQWVPPSIGSWNLTRNCSSYARFVSNIIRKSEQTILDLCAVDVYALHEYVASSLPPTFEKSTTFFTSQHTAIWYLSICERPISGTRFSQCHKYQPCETAINLQNEIYSMISQAQDGKGVCLKELRSSLDVKGNADMAGIGVSTMKSLQVRQQLKVGQVMASFCIEAFLITAILTAHVVTHLRRSTVSQSRGKNISDAFRAVLPTFYWSSVLISLGIISASLKASADASGDGQAGQLESWRKGESIYSPYETQLAAMASLVSAIPPFIAGIMLLQSNRRRPLKSIIILSFFIFLLQPMVTLFLLSDSHVNSISATAPVVKLAPADMLILEDYALSALFSLSLMMSVGSIVFLHSLQKSRIPQMSSNHSTCMMVFTWLAQVILLAMMIGALIIFFFIRAKIIGAGDSSQLEWSFGQVLALTTWIPVVVDFVYTICGKFKPLGPVMLYNRD